MNDPTAYAAIRNIERGGVHRKPSRQIRTLSEDDMRKMDERRKPVSFFEWVNRRLEEQNGF